MRRSSGLAIGLTHPCDQYRRPNHTHTFFFVLVLEIGSSIQRNVTNMDNYKAYQL